MKYRRFFSVLFSLLLVVGLFTGVIALQSNINFLGIASGEKANLVVDLSTSFSDTKNSWQHLAQGGEERGRSLKPVVGKIKKLKPKYIRIDHVFDFFDILQDRF